MCKYFRLDDFEKGDCTFCKTIIKEFLFHFSFIYLYLLYEVETDDGHESDDEFQFPLAGTCLNNLHCFVQIYLFIFIANKKCSGGSMVTNQKVQA